MSSKTLKAVILSSILTTSFLSAATETQETSKEKVCKEILNTKICDITDSCQEITMEDVLKELEKNGCMQIENKPGSNSTTCIATICGTR